MSKPTTEEKLHVPSLIGMDNYFTYYIERELSQYQQVSISSDHLWLQDTFNYDIVSSVSTFSYSIALHTRYIISYWRPFCWGRCISCLQVLIDSWIDLPNRQSQISAWLVSSTSPELPGLDLGVRFIYIQVWWVGRGPVPTMIQFSYL